MPDDVEAFGANLEQPPTGGSQGDLTNPRNQLDRDALAFVEHARETAKAGTADLRATVLGKPRPGAAEAEGDAAEGADAGEAGAEEAEAAAAEATAGDDAETMVALPDGTELPLNELIERATKGGLRADDYTRKTMELAERRRAIDAQEAALGSEVKRLGGLAQELEASIARTRTPAAELARLRAEDPGEWAARVEEQRLLGEQLARARAERSRAEAALVSARIPREIEALMAKAPEFKQADGSFNEELYNQVGRHAVKNLGYTEDEWAETIRHPQVIAAHAHMRQATRTRKVESVQQRLAGAPRVLRPGAASARPGDTGAETRRAQEALSKQPNSNDAIAAAFLARRRQAVAAVRRQRLGGAPS